MWHWRITTLFCHYHLWYDVLCLRLKQNLFCSVIIYVICSHVKQWLFYYILNKRFIVWIKWCSPMNTITRHATLCVHEVIAPCCTVSPHIAIPCHRRTLCRRSSFNHHQTQFKTISSPLEYGDIAYTASGVCQYQFSEVWFLSLLKVRSTCSLAVAMWNSLKLNFNKKSIWNKLKVDTM